MSRRLGPPLDLLLAPHCPAERARPALVDRFRALYPDHAIAADAGAPRRARGARRRTPPRRPQSSWSPASTPPTPRCTSTHLGLDVDELVGEVWGTGKGEVLREHGADDLRRRPRARRRGRPRGRGAQRLGADRRLHRARSCAAAGTDVVLADLDRVPGLARRAPAATAAGRPRRASCGRCGSADGRLQRRAPTPPSCWPRRCVRSAPSDVVAATGVLRLAARRPSATRPATSPTSLGVRGADAATPHEMEREGYRANAGDRCYFCKAELLDVLGPLADEHGLRRTSRPAPTPTTRVAGFRPGHPARPPSAARSPRCATPASPRPRSARPRARWGLPTWDKPAAACLSSRVAYGIEVTPARLARVERAEAALRAALADGRASTSATCGCATSATGPGRGRRRPLVEVARWPAVARRACAPPASPRSRSTRRASGPAR